MGQAQIIPCRDAALAGPAAGGRTCGGKRDRRARRVVLILVLIWMVSIFDLAFTLTGVDIGFFVELNPVARAFMSTSAGLTAFKLALVGLATAILFVLRRRLVTEVACWGLFIVHTALAFTWWEYYACFR